MIEVKNITKTYGKKQNIFTALRDVSLIIPEGASVAILGKSGSGKSTLVHAMSGLDRPQQGHVVVDGQDILRLKEKKVDRFRVSKMGFVFQSFFVSANETVNENVSLPLEVAKLPRALRRQRVAAALAAVELTDKAEVQARNLSGGQKQRLAIARAIVNSPKILFADEPTGNLDSATSATIEQLLFDYNKEQGVTLVIVTHDAELAGKCDMVVTIKDGEIEQVQRKQ